MVIHKNWCLTIYRDGCSRRQWLNTNIFSPLSPELFPWGPVITQFGSNQYFTTNSDIYGQLEWEQNEYIYKLIVFTILDNNSSIILH